MMKIFSRKTKPFAPRGLWMMVGFLALGLMGASGIGTGGTGEGGDNWHPFSLFSSDSNFTTFEKIALVVNLCVALSGLFYGCKTKYKGKVSGRTVDVYKYFKICSWKFNFTCFCQ